MSMPSVLGPWPADVIVDSQSVYGTIVGIENLTSPESCAHQGETAQCDVRTAFDEDSPYTFAVIIHYPA